MVNQDQLKDILGRIQAIESYLKISEKRIQLQEEELKTQDPTFWDDPKAAEIQMKSIRTLKFWIEAFDKLKTAYEIYLYYPYFIFSFEPLDHYNNFGFCK
jgi:peptide chain release factor 2